MINTERIGDIQSYVNPLLPQNTFASWSVFGENISWDVQYIVGVPNSIQFGNNDYRDELTGDAFPMGIIRGNFGTYFQVAARLEDNTALVQGNYYPLTNSDLPGIIKAFDSNVSVTLMEDKTFHTN